MTSQQSTCEVTPMHTPIPDRLIRDDDVAAILACSKATVWRRVADKTLPAPIRLGGLSRWSQSEILAVIEAAKAQRETNTHAKEIV